MTAESKKLSIFAERMIPDFIKENHSGFVTFVTKYFEFLEQEGNPYDLLTKIVYTRDIDNSINDFAEEWRKEYAPDMPESVRADLKLVIKHIREFFLQKGNENSFKFLFRTIFDEPIEFYYPRVDILRCSDGKWHKPTHLTVIKNDDTFPTINELAADWLFKEIIGLSSGDTAYVEGITEAVHPDDDPLNPVLPPVLALIVSENVGAFIENETLRYLHDENSPTIKTAVATAGASIIDTKDGNWTNTDGFLSSNKYLQDNYYYQEHSYQLRCGLSSDFYWRTIRKNVHPAGTIFFGVVDFLDGLLSQAGAITRAVGKEWLISWEKGAGALVQPNDNLWLESWVSSAIAAAWTYAFIERYRELSPFDALFLAEHFDALAVDIFATNANVSFPYSNPSEVTIV